MEECFGYRQNFTTVSRVCRECNVRRECKEGTEKKQVIEEELLEISAMIIRQINERKQILPSWIEEYNASAFRLQ